MFASFSDPIDVDRFVTINRRTLLKGIGASSLLTAGATLRAGSSIAAPGFSAYPFSLGVASGDPAPDGFVIWTKVAPKPLQRGGGMPMKPVEVAWQIASDPSMRQVARNGVAVAYAELGHAVHVEVAGLEPARDYYYRFVVGGERSHIGRARTLPTIGTPTAQIRFAHAGCQRYDDGFFTAYRRIAEENFDFLYHYGDYIYEYRVVRPGERPLPVIRTMPDEPDEAYTLDDYRHRYAIYKTDPDLQAAHASTPFIMSYDDHDVANNWAGDVPANVVPPEVFRLRRAAAFQAWYEHMPVRRALMPQGPNILAYRRFSIGDLMTLSVLDTRLYRTDQPCGDGFHSDCKAALEPQRTMLGGVQERWLYDGFKSATARWNTIAQQVMMMNTNRGPDPNVFLANMDQWAGAAAARDRLLDAVVESRLNNPVVLTGDVHNNWAGELRRSFAEEKTTVGVELIATSISSTGDGFDTDARTNAVVANNPHVKFFNNQRGYVRNTVTPSRWQADFQVLDKVSTRDGTLTTRKSLVIESGKSALADT